MAYYKTIDGVKYDADLIEKAEKAVAGKGDGRISKKDAEDLLISVVDGNNITDVEKDTMDYVKKNYKWTEDAESWFDAQIKAFNANKK